METGTPPDLPISQVSPDVADSTALNEEIKVEAGISTIKARVFICSYEKALEKLQDYFGVAKAFGKPCDADSLSTKGFVISANIPEMESPQFLPGVTLQKALDIYKARLRRQGIELVVTEFISQVSHFKKVENIQFNSLCQQIIEELNQAFSIRAEVRDVVNANFKPL